MEDTGVEGTVLLKCIFKEIKCNDVDCVQMAQHKGPVTSFCEHRVP
jgi:hypothetical protein